MVGFHRSETRRLLIRLGALALAIVLFGSLEPADAQTAGKVPKVGYLDLPNEPSGLGATASCEVFAISAMFRGKSIVVDVRGYTTNEQLRQALNDFVRLKVDVIFVGPLFAAMAAKQATGDIPIVCGSCGDPVENGLAASLARPGGNVTGLASLSAELIGKRVELMKELFPSVSRLAVFLHPANPGTRATLSVLDAAGRTRRIELQRVEIRGAGDFENAFRAVATSGAGGVVLQDDPLTRSARAQIAQLALGTVSRYPPDYRRLASPAPLSRTGPIAWTCTGEPPG